MEEDSKYDMNFWMEYTREFGAERLMSEPLGLRYYQQRDIDIIAIIALTFFILWKGLQRLCCRKSN